LTWKATVGENNSVPIMGYREIGRGQRAGPGGNRVDSRWFPQSAHSLDKVGGSQGRGGKKLASWVRREITRGFTLFRRGTCKELRKSPEDAFHGRQSCLHLDGKLKPLAHFFPGSDGGNKREKCRWGTHVRPSSRENTCGGKIGV